jgi:hypothetical protein
MMIHKLSKHKNTHTYTHTNWTDWTGPSGGFFKGTSFDLGFCLLERTFKREISWVHP